MSLDVEAPPLPGLHVQALRTRDPLSCAPLSRLLVDRYLIFDGCVGGERRVDLHPLLLTQKAHAQAASAATAVGRLINSVADRALHGDEEEAARYGLSRDALRLARASHLGGDRATLSRVDLLLGEDGFRACEINADCPGGHNEALGLPALAQAAGFYDGLNPTTLVEDLADELQRLTRGEGAVALLYATAYAEDLQVCAIVQRALLQRGVKAILCAPTALTRRGFRLFVQDQPVAVLYRYFPTEYMEGQRNLDAICDAVQSGAVRTLANFGQIFAQSKLAFARAHALRPRLAQKEQAALALLPATHAVTDVDPEQLRAEQPRFVIKRALGRVGEDVFVGALLSSADWERAIALSRAEHKAREEVWVAQAFIPQRPVPTPFGPRLVTLGAYLLNGRFVGYFARLTRESHASHDALCLPVFVSPRGARDAGRAPIAAPVEVL